MHGEHSVRRSRPAGSRLVLEPLERRMLLSGNVTVFVSGADLIVLGDADDNSVSITQDSLEFADQFQVTGLDGTTINNGVDPHLFQGVFGDVQFAMGDGSDSVQVDDVAVGGDLLFDGGDGDNTLTVDPSSVAGDLVVTNGQGNDATTLQDVIVGGSVLISNGDGGSLVTLATVSGTTSVGCDLVIKNGDGVDSQVLNDFEVDGNVSIDNGDGGVLLAGMTVAAVPVTGSITQMQDGSIGGSLSVKNKAGIDEQIITGTVIGGNVKIDNGEGDPQPVMAVSEVIGGIHDSETALLYTTIGGNLSIKNKDGVDSQNFDEVSVGGNLSISNGNGGSLINFAPTLGTVTIGGNLTIKNKDGADQVQLAALQVGGNIAIDNGTGGSEVVTGDIETSTVGGNLSIKDRTDLGAGLSNFEVWGNLSLSGGREGGVAMLTGSRIHGSLSFKGAGPGDQLGLSGMEINGNTSVRDGKGDFTFQSTADVGANVLDGSLRIRNQGGAFTATIDQTSVGSSLSIGNKNGGSMIDITGLVLGPVGGRLTVKTGAGVDVLTLDSVTVDGATFLDGGKGLNDALAITGGTFAFAPVYVNFEDVSIT